MERTGPEEKHKREMGKRIGATTCITWQEKVKKKQATGARKHLQY